jgi:hypothetical protein
MGFRTTNSTFFFLFKTRARDVRFPFKSIEERRRKKKKVLKEIQSDVYQTKARRSELKLSLDFHLTPLCVAQRASLGGEEVHKQLRCFDSY